jgi:hypothetical protein
MDNFNLKQYLFESRVGMYSKAVLNESALLDAETLAGEIAKKHPELIRYHHDGEGRKLQDAIFTYAGEILQGAGIPLQTVRGLAYDTAWALDLVNGVKDALEHGGDNLEEVNPAALGAPQAAADAKMQQQDDENGDMVDNASMDVMAEDDTNPMEAAYGNVGSVDKVKPAETGISKYLDILNAHDWFYHFSDDHRTWQKGQADKDNLKALYSTLTPDEKQQAMDTFIDKYLQVYKPDQFPTAANNVKYLTTNTFKGAI